MPWNAHDFVAEQALIEASRLEREAMAYDMDALESYNEEDGAHD